jgi:hypothetical protein
VKLGVRPLENCADPLFDARNEMRVILPVRPWFVSRRWAVAVNAGQAAPGNGVRRTAVQYSFQRSRHTYGFERVGAITN